MKLTQSSPAQHKSTIKSAARLILSCWKELSLILRLKRLKTKSSLVLRNLGQKPLKSLKGFRLTARRTQLAIGRAQPPAQKSSDLMRTFRKKELHRMNLKSCTKTKPFLKFRMNRRFQAQLKASTLL